MRNESIKIPASIPVIELVRARLARLDKLEREGKKIADTTMLQAFIKAVGKA